MQVRQHPKTDLMGIVICWHPSCHPSNSITALTTYNNMSLTPNTSTIHFAVLLGYAAALMFQLYFVPYLKVQNFTVI